MEGRIEMAARSGRVTERETCLERWEGREKGRGGEDE